MQLSFSPPELFLLSYLDPPDAPLSFPVLLDVVEGCWRPLDAPASVSSRLVSEDED